MMVLDFWQTIRLTPEISELQTSPLPPEIDPATSLHVHVQVSPAHSGSHLQKVELAVLVTADELGVGHSADQSHGLNQLGI